MSHIDSAASMTKILKAAGIELEPPPHVVMEEKDLPFFTSVIGEFALFEWTPHQLELAAMLARTMADFEYEQRKLREEGSVSKTEKGTPVANPRKTIVQMHSSTILSMRKSLSIHARAKLGESRDAAKRRQKAKEAEKGAAKTFEDDLIARPTAH